MHNQPQDGPEFEQLSSPHVCLVRMLFCYVGNACADGNFGVEMALHFDLPVTAVTRTFGALTIGNLIGAAFAMTLTI